MPKRFAACAISTVFLSTIIIAQPPVVRTADPIKRGMQLTDFPRTVKVAGNVYTYEDFHAGPEKFTTTNMFVVTSDGVLVADGQGSVAETKGLVDAIKPAVAAAKGKPGDPLDNAIRANVQTGVARLKALRERYQPRRLFCVFQPHQHSRTRFLLNDFATSFAAADETIVPDIFFVRDSEAERSRVSAADLVDRVSRNGQHARRYDRSECAN